MEQMFLMVRGAVQGSFRAGVASVSVHVVLRPGLGAWRCFHPPQFFFGVNLDYLDFSGGSFDF